MDIFWYKDTVTSAPRWIIVDSDVNSSIAYCCTEEEARTVVDFMNKGVLESTQLPRARDYQKTLEWYQKRYYAKGCQHKHETTLEAAKCEDFPEKTITALVWAFGDWTVTGLWPSEWSDENNRIAWEIFMRKK